MWDPAEHLESLAEDQILEISIIWAYLTEITSKCVKIMIFVRFWCLVLELHMRSQENFSRVSDLFATELMWDPAAHLESLAEN